LFEKSGHFYIRYYTTISNVCKQMAEPLCEKDENHYSKSCKAVRLLCDKFMLKVISAAAKGWKLGDRI